MVSYGELYEAGGMKARELARKELVQLYRKTKSISETARRCGTSRNVVRKWVRRFDEAGDPGLKDRSRRPNDSPRRTSEEIQQKVMRLRKKTSWGRKRIANKLQLNPWTVRNIFRQNGIKRDRKRRKVFYPAHWAWETKEPFTLAQVDTKDVLDKSGIGTDNYTRYWNLKLPRYQWTFLEATSRLRFLAYSYQLNQMNGTLFVALVMAWGITTEIFWQEDWGNEFGGSNYHRLHLLNEKWYKPFNAILGRAPKGRKGYQGSVERSHRTDDEEFYIPIIPRLNSHKDLLQRAQQWQFYYNAERPHFGYKMDGLTPLRKLRQLHLNLPKDFANFPVMILDKYSLNLLRQQNILQKPGNELLTLYSCAAARIAAGNVG
jgi:transposase